jgi:hypothetical protein
MNRLNKQNKQNIDFVIEYINNRNENKVLRISKLKFEDNKISNLCITNNIYEYNSSNKTNFKNKLKKSKYIQL